MPPIPVLSSCFLCTTHPLRHKEDLKIIYQAISLKSKGSMHIIFVGKFRSSTSWRSHKLFLRISITPIFPRSTNKNHLKLATRGDQSLNQVRSSYRSGLLDLGLDPWLSPFPSEMAALTWTASVFALTHHLYILSFKSTMKNLKVSK